MQCSAFTFLLLLVAVGCEEILKMAVGPRSLASHHQSVTDNGYIYQVKSFSSLGILNCEESKQSRRLYSE